MKEIIQKEYKVLKLFSIKFLEFSTVATIEGINEPKKLKNKTITDKDYKILEKYRNAHNDFRNNNQELVEDNKRWWQE